MTGSIEVLGQYQTQSVHTLPGSPLDEALASMEGVATRFSLDAINDAQTRASYAANIKRISAQVRSDVAAGRISSQAGVEFCHEMRNKIMAEHRKLTSATGLAKAQQHKQTPPTLPELFEKYAARKFGKKVKETARQGMIIGAGAAGGFLAGLGVSLVCGPGAPFCAIALVLAGSAAGGVAGSLAADALDDELEELSNWEVF
ncbi:hypothetical protein [Stutzerimonas stutzeri]|uniref:Uncharacterized protein n=1 Tax=Stutzerimonas stutzeri TaxID=316 RepID=A0A0D9AMN9_STUST|nr:hypothetical protein [Stutzerimonas stutzeri]KJH82295.1 hypothetical protein UF78_09125 [Stutzerimonas stutzeri]